MSDILIKGKEMPKKCLGSLTGVGDCPIVGKCKIFQNTDLKTKEKIAWDSRLPNCPLVELPEHGRLGDLDKLASKVAEAQEQMKGKDYDPFMLLGDVLRWISLTPTVLEASK